jgi:hypothetical protein
MLKESPSSRENDTITVSRADVAGVGQDEVNIQNAIDLEQTGEGAKRTKLRLYAILAALFLSLFVAALDATIIATAIPTIAAQLHSASGYTWIGGAYLLGNAASGPVGSPLRCVYSFELKTDFLLRSGLGFLISGAGNPSCWLLLSYSLPPLSSVRLQST